MLHTAPPTSARRRLAVPAAALSLFACFLLALSGHGLQPAPREIGKLAVSSRDVGTATIPRQGAPVRIASPSHREHAKSPAACGALGLPCFAALAAIAGSAVRLTGPASVLRPAVDVAHFARGPPVARA